MKRNDIRSLATKTEAELQTQLQTINLELSKARLAKTAGKLANLRLISHLHDDVARIKTNLHRMKLQSQPKVVEVTEVVAKEVKAVKTVIKKKVSKAKTK